MKKAIKENNFNALADCLYENNKLWTALAVDCMNDDNLLPDDLRASIISLSIFVQKHMHQVLTKKASAVPLLEINAMILRGLKTEGTSECQV